jgi:hypothetical protein
MKITQMFIDRQIKMVFMHNEILFNPKEGNSAILTT